MVIAAAVLGDRNPCEELTEQLDEVGISPKVRYAVGGHCAGWSNFPNVPINCSIRRCSQIHKKHRNAQSFSIPQARRLPPRE